MNEAERKSARVKDSKIPMWKRRCKVYKCDEACDTGATDVLLFVRHKVAEEEQEDALFSAASDYLTSLIQLLNYLCIQLPQ